MRIALIADIHANLPALEAVLADIKKREPDMILSLGDQINLGPCPRQTLELLRAEAVTCLSGNHERYILAAMREDPAYSGANFASLRFNTKRVTAQEITFRETLEIDGITFCHAIPGDDRFPVHQPNQAVPMLREMYRRKQAHIICGHGHNPAHYTIDGLRLDAIGSTGCMDRGIPGATCYTMLTLDQGDAVLQPVSIPFDADRLPSLFRQSGMVQECPIMAHIICLQMQRNHDYLVPFVELARQLSMQNDEEQVSERTWSQADQAFHWPDGMDTAAFWRRSASQ